MAASLADGLLASPVGTLLAPDTMPERTFVWPLRALLPAPLLALPLTLHTFTVPATLRLAIHMSQNTQTGTSLKVSIIPSYLSSALSGQPPSQIAQGKTPAPHPLAPAAYIFHLPSHWAGSLSVPDWPHCLSSK